MTNRDFRFPKPFRFGQIGRTDDESKLVASTSGIGTKEGVLEPAFSQSPFDPAFDPGEFRAKARPYQDPPQVKNPKVLEDLERLDRLAQMPLDDLMKEEKRKKPVKGFEPESYALPGAFAERDPQVADREMALKLQALVDKLKDYKEKIKELRDQNLELAQAVFEKDKKLEELNLEKSELEQEMAAFGIEGKGGKGKYNNLRVISKNALDEEEQRRRLDQKRELLQGIALVEGDFEDFLGRRDQEKNWIQRIYEALYRVLLKFTLLKGDLKHVEAYYDKSIGAYFTFYKYLVNASLFILLIYGYLLLSHPFVADDQNYGLCGGSPCILLYYSYSTSEDLTYSSTIAALVIITLFAAIWKWIRSDAFRRRAEIYGGRDAKLKKYAAMVFNSWDWSIRTQVDSGERSINLYNLLSTALADDVRIQEAASRSQAQKTKIYIRRIMSMILNGCLLLSGWASIVVILIFSKDFTDMFAGNSTYIIFLVKLGPTLLIALINALVPAITLKLTRFEEWDDPAFLVKVQIMKLFVAKSINAAIYAVLNLDLAVGGSWFGTDGISFQSTTYNCREDQAGMNLVLMVISDAIVSKVVGLALPLLDKCRGKCSKTPVAKREIKVAQQVINLVYTQTLIWLTYPYYPYVAVLAPIFLYIDFKFQLWRLKRLLAKPKEQTQASVTHI